MADRAGSDRADGQRWYAEAEEQWRRVGYREWLRDPTLTAPAASRSTVNTNLSSADRPGRCLVKLGRSAELPRLDHVPRSIASKAPRDC